MCEYVMSLCGNTNLFLEIGVFSELKLYATYSIFKPHSQNI